MQDRSECYEGSYVWGFFKDYMRSEMIEEFVAK